MILIEYDRQKAVDYAKKWALSRNPEYYDYSGIGGNCTSFVSQSVYAGCGVMNYTRDFGWYYLNANDKSPSWTGVNYFFDFMTQNQNEGPFGEQTGLRDLVPGDVIQLQNREGKFYHTVILTSKILTRRGTRYYICSHSKDAYQKNLFSYSFADLRCIHIIGARKKEYF